MLLLVAYLNICVNLDMNDTETAIDFLDICRNGIEYCIGRNGEHVSHSAFLHFGGKRREVASGTDV